MWQFIEANKRKTAILIFLLTAFLVFVFGMLGYYCYPAMEGLLIGLLLGVVASISIVFYIRAEASRYFLKEAGAIEAKKETTPVLYNVVEEMAIASALGFTPKVYIVPSLYPNAFSVGINEKNGAVAVTSALLSILNRDELQGVIAHEIAHIKNQDTLYMMYAGMTLGVVACIAQAVMRSNIRAVRSSRSKGSGGAVIILLLLICIIVAPIFMKLLYFSLSRKREFLADASACQYTRYPTGLASALHKIATHNVFAEDKKDGQNPIIEAMNIYNRLQENKKSFFGSLFSTHPDTSTRIEILKKMGASDISEYNKIYSRTVKNSGLISKKTLDEMKIKHIAIVAGAMADNSVEKENALQKQRQANDAYYISRGYKIIECECKTKLKIPPNSGYKEIKCPHCKKVHQV